MKSDPNTKFLYGFPYAPNNQIYVFYLQDFVFVKMNFITLKNLTFSIH